MEISMAELPKGPRAHTCSVAQSAPHQILVCKACKHKDQACKPGFELLKKLRAAVQAAGLAEDFEVSGTACLAGCLPAHGKPCVVGWRATAKATWFFGDIDPDQPLDDLIVYARSHAAPDDGWISGHAQPARASAATPTRVPAAIIVTREGVIQ